MPSHLPNKNTVTKKFLILMQHVEHTFVNNFVALTQTLLIDIIVKHNEWHIPPTGVLLAVILLILSFQC